MEVVNQSINLSLCQCGQYKLTSNLSPMLRLPWGMLRIFRNQAFFVFYIVCPQSAIIWVKKNNSYVKCTNSMQIERSKSCIIMQRPDPYLGDVWTLEAGNWTTGSAVGMGNAQTNAKNVLSFNISHNSM